MVAQTRAGGASCSFLTRGARTTRHPSVRGAYREAGVFFSTVVHPAIVRAPSLFRPRARSQLHLSTAATVRLHLRAFLSTSTRNHTTNLSGRNSPFLYHLSVGKRRDLPGRRCEAKEKVP
jgi:hypothetical protein